MLQLTPWIVTIWLWIVYGAAVRKLWWTMAAGAGSMIGTLAILHQPVRPVSPALPPPWVGEVQGCAQSLTPPEAPVRILQWTLEDVGDAAGIVDLVQSVQPDVTVLHGRLGRGIGAALVEAMGGEFVVREPTAGEDGRVVHTTGAFHLCGRTSDWSEGVEGPYGTSLLFVGAHERAVFPLVVSRLPAVGDELVDWGAEASRARGRLAGIAEVIGATSTVAVADSSAALGYRHLEGAMLGAGLARVPSPPSGPVRWMGLPVLAVQPWDEAWIGPAWSVRASKRLAVEDGVRGAIVTDLAPRGGRTP